MAAELGRAYVQIVPSAKGISGGIANAMQPGAKSAGEQAGTTISRTMGQKISAVGKNFIAAGAIATAVSVPIVNGIKDALSAYEVQATAETKLTEIYKTRMGVSDEVAKKTMDLASALQKEGVIGDEVTISGAQQLATFAKYPGTVDKLLPAMDNLLAQQKGVNATTDDAVNIGNLMGKVLQGQTGALKRVGISFTDAQEEVLKYGTEEEKAAMLAEVINDNVGNMNEELAKTPSGQMQQLKNTMGDLKEEIGAALAPVLAQLAGYISEKIIPVVERFIKFLHENPVIAKIIIAVAGLLAVGGPLLIMLGSLLTILPLIGTAFSALIGPIGIAIAIIGALVAAGIVLYKNWDKIKKFAAALKDALVKKFTEMKTRVVQLFTGIKEGMLAPIRAAKDWLSKTWNNIRDRASNGLQRVKDAIVGPIEKARDKIRDIIDRIKEFFDFKVSMPHIKLPHFSIHPKGWHLGDLLEGVIPSLSIDWYAQGGIMKKPTLFGGGEAGAEAIVPLDPFWNRIDALAERVEMDYVQIGRAVAEALAESPTEVHVTLDGRTVGRSVNRELYRQGQLDWRHA